MICTACLVLSAAHADGIDPVLSSRIYHRLAHLQPDFEAGRFELIRTQIEKLLPTTRDGNPYDRAVLLQMLGQVQARLEHPEQAISAFEEARALDILPHDDALQLERELALLYVQQDRYADAVAILETLPEPDRESRLLLAQSYLQLARYRDAGRLLEELTHDGQSADKTLYEALFFCQHTLGETSAAASTLQELIEIEPDAPIYWRQLASLHYENGSTNHALAVLEAAYLQDVLQADDLLNMVSLYQAEGVPYKAAMLLQRLLDERRLDNSIERHEQLVNLWLSARETVPAIKTLKRLIARSPTAERWLRLGQMHIDQAQWSSATLALKTAVNTETTGNSLSPERLAEAWLWLGIAYFESGHQQQARIAFQRSERYSFTRLMAQQWLSYLESSG